MGGYVPPLRRKDSFGLEFSYFPDMAAASEVLFDRMKIRNHDILGVQNLNRSKIVIKMNSNTVFENVMREFEDRILVFSSTRQVKVINLSASYSYVSIRNAPFEMDDGVLINILSRYGKVDSVRHNKFSVGPFEGLYNGVRTAKMRIRENIPSSCTISGHNVSFMYNGQVKTCFKCGLNGHLVKDCTTAISERVNIFDDDDFPEIESGKKNDGKNQSNKVMPIIENGQEADSDGTEDLQLKENLKENDVDENRSEEVMLNEEEIRENEENNSAKQKLEDLADVQVLVAEAEVHHHKNSNIELSEECRKGKGKRGSKRQKEILDMEKISVATPVNVINDDDGENHEGSTATAAAVKETWHAKSDDNPGLKITLKKDINKDKNVNDMDVSKCQISSDDDVAVLKCSKRYKTDV